MENFGDWMKQKRAERGWTLAYLARECEIPESSLYKYETGGVKPGFDALVRIARALGVELLQDARITLDTTPTKVENLVDGINNLDISDSAKAKLLSQALRILETELEK